MKSFNEWAQTDEALSLAQRRKKAMAFRRIKHKVQRGKEIAKRKMAAPEKLKLRAKKQARLTLFKKFSKGISPSDISISMRRTIEDKLKTKTAVINRLTKKLYPKVKKAEVARLKSFKSGGTSTPGQSIKLGDAPFGKT